MKKFGLIGALLLMLALAGCAGITEGTVNPNAGQTNNPSWGTDPTCAPGCAVGQGGGW